jgi:hypothetical protein
MSPEKCSLYLLILFIYKAIIWNFYWLNFQHSDLVFCIGKHTFHPIISNFIDSILMWGKNRLTAWIKFCYLNANKFERLSNLQGFSNSFIINIKTPPVRPYRGINKKCCPRTPFKKKFVLNLSYLTFV